MVVLAQTTDCVGAVHH